MSQQHLYFKKNQTLLLCNSLRNVILGFIFLIGCSNQESSLSDSSFGLPGKSDQSCDRTSILCWSDTEVSLVQDLMDAELDYLTQEGTGQALQDILLNLVYKLTVEEQDALEELQDQFSSQKTTPPTQEQRVETLQFAFNSVYGRILGGYIGAYSTLMSSIAAESEEWIPPTLDDSTSSSLSSSDLERDSKQDSISKPFPQSIQPKPQLEEAFQTLWSQGPMGQYMVFMLHITGVTQKLPRTSSWDDQAIASGEGLDKQANQMIEKYTLYSTLESTFSNLQSLIPVVGTFISIPYGIYAQFKQRMHMTFELCALYGFDLNQTDDFLIAVNLFMMAQGFREVLGSFVQALVGVQAYSILAQRSPEILPTEFSLARIQELRSQLLGQIGVVGIKLLPKLTGQAAKGLSQSLFNQITFGVGAIADIALDLWATQSMGHELKWMTHPWGWALFLERNERFKDPQSRQCALNALGSVIKADQRIRDDEIEFFTSSLIRPFYVGNQRPSSHTVLITGIYPYLASNVKRTEKWGIWMDQEQHEISVDLSIWSTSENVVHCLQETWAKATIFEQLSLVSWLQLMAYSDWDLNASESQRLETLFASLPIYESHQADLNWVLDRINQHILVDLDLADQLWLWGTYSEADLQHVNSEEWKNKIQRRFQENGF